MKKVMIGGFLLFAGLFTTLTIILTAGIYATSLKSWSGSKLWFSIFGDKAYGDEVVESLFLGFPFIIGILLAIAGLIVLGIEYFKKS